MSPRSRGLGSSMALAIVALALAIVGLVSWNRMSAATDEISQRVEQLSDRQVRLEPAIEDAARVSRSGDDLPPPLTGSEPKLHRVRIQAKELDGTLADGTTYRYWTFDGTVPGPMLRVRVGDTVELTLENAADSEIAHNIDLHAVNGPGGGAEATMVRPGEERTFRFKALHPGLFVYHCAAPHVPTHIAMGMYGLILVEPQGGLPPVDKEFYIVQGEIYANAPPRVRGHAEFSEEGLRSENPHYVVFNGQFQALSGDHALKASVGDRVRVFVGNAGPNLVSSFHVIGEIFDVVHKEGGTDAIHNIQTTLIPAGGATWVEFTIDVPGEYILVDHSISRSIDKGALAVLLAEGAESTEIFDPLDVRAQSARWDSGYEYERPASPDGTD